MKQILHSEHWPHLKRRALLELFGLSLIIIFVISEWELIDSSLFAIRNGDLFYLLGAFFLWWLMLPLTAVSYRVLSHKKIPIVSTTLSHLAGAGPGRIIPGGLGHITMGIFHLKKLGLPIHKAAAISLTNNMIGVIVNVLVFLLVILLNPDIGESTISSISTGALIFLNVLIMGVVVLCVWLLHFRKIRKTVVKSEKQFIILSKKLFKNPKKLISLILIALIILLGNVIILQLCGDALQLSISSSDAVIALSIGVLVGGLLPTPGGLFGVEAGIATSLALLGFSSQDAVSVALLFRTVTYWQPLIPGTFAYLYLRERNLI